MAKGEAAGNEWVASEQTSWDHISIDPPVPPLPLFPVARRPRLWWFLVFALLSVAGGVYIALFGTPGMQLLLDSMEVDRVSRLLAFVLALVVSVILHELGHLIAALLLGLRVVAVSLGPFQLQRLHGKFQLQLQKTPYSGAVQVVPKGPRSWRVKFLVTVAAGPVATLLSGLLAVWLVASEHGANSATTAFLADLAVVNLASFVLSLVPSAPGRACKNDARLVLSLAQNASAAERLPLAIEAGQWLVEGIRPRDYPAEKVRRLALLGENREQAIIFSMIVAGWADDRSDVATAEAWYARTTELSKEAKPPLRAMALAEVAAFDFCRCHDAEQAREKLAAVDLRLLKTPWQRYRTEALQSVLSNDGTAAMAAIEKAKGQLPSNVPCFECERELLEELRARIKAPNTLHAVS